jgi:hypothetical protein
VSGAFCWGAILGPGESIFQYGHGIHWPPVLNSQQLQHSQTQFFQQRIFTAGFLSGFGRDWFADVEVDAPVPVSG